MSDYPRLSHPPLREAVISILLANELALEVIEKLKDQRFDDFASSKPIRRGQFRVQIGNEAAQGLITKDELDGWRYDSKDGSRVLQLRRAGMTCSLLRGYTSWDDFRASASKLWTRFCEFVGDAAVEKLALRYINVVRIPHGADFDDFLAAGPRIPPQAPQLLNGFFHRVEIPFADSGAIAIVTQVLEPPDQVSIPVVLDIDVQGTVRLDGYSEEIWAHLNKLRDLKNLLFFSSLTKRALELFQ